MKQMPVYKEYHPRWYRRPVSTYWWLGRWPYLKFILRELSSIFVALFVVITLMQIRALRHGPQAYVEFQDWLRNPFLIALSAVGFCFVVLHTVTWFHLSPKAMVVRVRGKRIPDWLIIGPNYAAWLAVSVLIAWLLSGG